MKKLKQIFCGLFIATFMIAPAVAAQNVSRTAVNTERARAVGTAPSVSVRAKQPVVAQRGGAHHKKLPTVPVSLHAQRLYKNKLFIPPVVLFGLPIF